MNEYSKEIEELKYKVNVLEKYNAELHLENNALKLQSYTPYNVYSIDDSSYAEEASAPPSNHVEEKAVIDVVIPKVADVPAVVPAVVPAAVEEPAEESTKTVKMIGTKTKQEYQREYQRNYRKKQKNITMNL